MDCLVLVDWFFGVVDELFGILRVVYESNFGIVLRIWGRRLVCFWFVFYFCDWLSGGVVCCCVFFVILFVLNFFLVCYIVCVWFLIFLGLVSFYLFCFVLIFKNVMWGMVVLFGEYLMVMRLWRSWGCVVGCVFVRFWFVWLVNYNVMWLLCLVFVDNLWICIVVCNFWGLVCLV